MSDNLSPLVNVIIDSTFNPFQEGDQKEEKTESEAHNEMDSKDPPKQNETEEREKKRKPWSAVLAILGLTFGGTVLISILIKGFRILSGSESIYYY
jgi:hypothetical protein